MPEPDSLASEIIPWSLVAAVTMDAAVDGLLIGLAYVATPRAGYDMPMPC
ncbi:hypothetical protein OAN61_00335 [bacterium]|nr:hypothetical protein [bacterium]